MSNAPMGESRKPERKLTSGRGFARLNSGDAPREVMCVPGAKHKRIRSSRSSAGASSGTSRVASKSGPRTRTRSACVHSSTVGDGWRS
jgi:hypothetical protein